MYLLYFRTVVSSSHEDSTGLSCLLVPYDVTAFQDFPDPNWPSMASGGEAEEERAAISKEHDIIHVFQDTSE